ncbi:MAG: fumarylacetoacetate hydrolase family protein [Sphingomicrobium sp.]
MRLVTFEAGRGERIGALVANDAIVDLNLAGELSRTPVVATMQALIEAGEPGLQIVRELAQSPQDQAVLKLSEVQLLAPLPKPVRLRDCCLFLEHMERALEKLAKAQAAKEAAAAGASSAPQPSAKYTLPAVFKNQIIYYNANHLQIYGPEREIVWPSHSDWMDFELEWACVIGSAGTEIAPETARSHIFGYTIFNDWSARDLQLEFMAANLGPGEGKDFANGLGPCIATPDEFDDPYSLTMTASVNGEEWSRGSTASMHHRFEDAIVQFSRSRPLAPGEIIGSGTVLSGCGFELDRRLSEGDSVELSVEGIGTLRNRVVRR